MPRPLSPAARRAALAGETAEVFLVLLVISDLPVGGPLRFVNNTETIWSRAHGDADPQEYIAWPFNLTLPDERDDQVGAMRLVIDNVDPRIIREIRPMTSAPLLTFYIVLASSPDVVEAGPFEGRLAAVDYDAQTITATLRAPEVFAEPFPWRLFTPNAWPAIFP